MLRLSGVEFESMVDAPGVTAVLFFSGCRHHCPGCHNPKTHSFDHGIELTDEVVNRINQEIDKRPFLGGLVLSGGDPMYSASEILQILPKLHIPKGNLWCYTGFTWEELVKDPDMCALAKKCSFIVDGLYLHELRDASLCYRGSSNQRIWKNIGGSQEQWMWVDVTDKLSYRESK